MSVNIFCLEARCIAPVIFSDINISKSIEQFVLNTKTSIKHLADTLSQFKEGKTTLGKLYGTEQHRMLQLSPPTDHPHQEQ